VPIRSHVPHFFDPQPQLKTMRNLIRIFALAVLVTTGCDSGDVVEQDVAQVQVRLELENLPPLQDGFAYQAWVQVGFVSHASDRFNVTENGSFVNDAGQFIQNALVFEVDISEATEVFVTIEDKRDSDDQPSGTVVLAGDVSGSTATLSTNHERALGVSFEGQSGTFMLLNWASGASTDETSGLWFIDGTRAAPTAGLSLPTLPEGWVYEGWMDQGGTLVSTGAFRENDSHDLARQYSNTDTPSFPGEDFLENAPEGVSFPLDPSGGTVRVTVEPFPDDTVAPYGIFILSGSVPASPSSATPYPLQTEVAAPSGTATLF